KFVCTDPGVGILQPGWHGSGPPPVGPPPPPPGPNCGGGGSSFALESAGGDCSCPNPGLDKCVNRCRTDLYICAGFTGVGALVCGALTLGGCTPVGAAALAYCVTTRLVCGSRCEEDNPSPCGSSLAAATVSLVSERVSPQGLPSSDPTVEQILDKVRQI